MAQLVLLLQRRAQLHRRSRLAIFEWHLHALKHLSLIRPGMLVSLHCDAYPVLGVLSDVTAFLNVPPQYCLFTYDVLL